MDTNKNQIGAKLPNVKDIFHAFDFDTETSPEYEETSAAITKASPHN